MNITLLWVLLIPVLGAGSIFYVVMREDLRTALVTSLAALFIGVLVSSLAFYASYGAAVADTEIINGQITNKVREHGSYTHWYDCNCTSHTDSDGHTTQTCQRCSEDHYTVEWYANSTIGRFDIDSIDRTSKRVYNTPDPHRYSIINQGDPVAKQHSYENYVQAVPESLFAKRNLDLSTYGGLMVDYPINVYDLYKIDRFISPGFSFVDAPQWNLDISNMLRNLGPSKQVNVIVVIAKTADRQYPYALQKKWEGANKNDVVLVIGSLDGLKIEFVDVISWTKSEIFKIELIDRINDMGAIKRDAIMQALSSQIAKNFERRHMAEFEYLKHGEIDPPGWLITTLAIVLSVGYGAIVFYISRQPGGRRGRRQPLHIWPFN